MGRPNFSAFDLNVSQNDVLKFIKILLLISLASCQKLTSQQQNNFSSDNILEVSDENRTVPSTTKTLSCEISQHSAKTIEYGQDIKFSLNSTFTTYKDEYSCNNSPWYELSDSAKVNGIYTIKNVPAGSYNCQIRSLSFSNETVLCGKTLSLLVSEYSNVVNIVSSTSDSSSSNANGRNNSATTQQTNVINNDSNPQTVVNAGSVQTFQIFSDGYVPLSLGNNKFDQFNVLARPENLASDGGRQILFSNVSSAFVQSTRIRIFVPPGTLSWSVAFQPYNDGVQDYRATAAFNKIPTATADQVTQSTYSDTSFNLQHLINGQELNFYGFPGAGGLNFAQGSYPTSFKTGGWIYINLLKVPGNAFISLQNLTYVDQDCYRKWFQKGLWDSSGNPQEGVLHTCQ